MRKFHRWIWAAWAVWVLAMLAAAARPFLWHVNLFRQIDPRLYRLLLVALPLGVLAGTAYHFLRRRGFWRLEPAVLPAVLLLLCALYAPLAVLVTLWMVLAAWAAGRQALAWLGIKADLSLSALAGLGLFSCALFVVGISGAFRAGVFAALFAVPLAALPRHWRDLRGELADRWRAWREDPESTAPHVSLAVFAAVVLALLAAAKLLTPVWDGDAVRFHLALVRVYLLQHSVAVPAAISYGYYPQGFEVLAAAAYALGGQVAAQCVNPVFFCLALLLVYRLARACGIARSWAFLGTVLGASVPFLHWTGSAMKNDLPMAAYELAALACYFAWREDSNFRWIVCGSFFIALSFGVKHVALFGGIPLGLAYAYAVWRQPKKFRSALAVLAVLIVFGPLWQIRTYLATGSPLTPATAGIASPAGPLRSGESRLMWYLRVPYRAHFDGKRQFESASANPSGILLLLLAPLWLIPAAARPQRRAEIVLWFFLLLYYGYWCLAIPAALRYFIAPVLLLAVLGAARLASAPRWLSMAALSASLLFALPVLIVMEMAPAQVPLFLKQIDGATFLRRTLPPYGAVEYLAKHARASDRIASVGDWAAAYAPNPANFKHYYRDDRRYQVQQVRRILADGKSAYLILPNSSNRLDLEAAAGQDYQLRQVYQDGDFVVYALTPRNGRGPGA